MRHRPGWGWLLAALATCALAAAGILILMALFRPVGAAELVRLRPGEIDLLTKVVAAESTGEPEQGQRAVAWVAINRMQDAPETFGKTLTRVLLAPSQFARPVPIADNSPSYLRAMLATLRAVLGEGGDPSGGALYFCRCDMKPMPAWSRQFQRTAVIGRHCFFRPAD